MLAPEFEVYAPWRDEEFLAKFPGRSEMIDFCQEKGLSVTASKDKPYSHRLQPAGANARVRTAGIADYARAFR